MKPERTVGRSLLHHVCNALHVYSILRRLGVRKSLAAKLATLWERTFHDFIYSVTSTSASGKS